MNSSTHLRSANEDDVDRLTGIFLRARAAAMPWLPAVHTDEETRQWMEHVVLTQDSVWIVVDETTLPVGFAATKAGWLDHLYVAPEAQRQGVGRRLLAVTKRHNSKGLQLHVFQRNHTARQFYERAGFQHIADHDGSSNEENEPDSTYRWQPGRAT